MVKIHIDTDIGGDIDDLCALAMVLAWPGAELAGVTTNSDDGGRRAGDARYAEAEVVGGWLRQSVDSSAAPARVVTAIDGERFKGAWLGLVSGISTAGETPWPAVC